MKFLASYLVVAARNQDDQRTPRRVEVTAGSVVPLDDEARAVPPNRRTDTVRAILLGQRTGEVQRSMN
jgi:hypothetical protein